MGRWAEVPSDRIEVTPGADGLVAIGGGSAIDTAKAASEATGLPLVSVPTTYSGAEWAPSYGVRTHDRRMVGGGGGAHLAGIVYDVDLTLGLPVSETVGTALNALAHCAEALYGTRSDESDRCAIEGRRADLALAAARCRGAARPRGPRGPAARCRRGGRGARAGRPRPGARDGAGARRHLRAAARRDERPDASARAPLQRADRPGGRRAVRAGDRSRGRSCRRRSSSWRGSAGSSGSATSASPRASFPRSPRWRRREAGNRRNPRPATAQEIETLLRSIY